jgi:hypothetical protein
MRWRVRAGAGEGTQKVTDTMPPSRPRAWTALLRQNDLGTIVACLAVILAVGFVSFILGVNTGDREVAGFKGAMLRLQDDNQKLTADNQRLQAKLVDLQAKLAKAQAALNSIMPSADTYQIGQNNSVKLADGRLTIGLVGTPGNNSIDLNVNGKQYSGFAGTVINIPVDPSTNCRLEILSFDVLSSQVTVNATCTTAKP